MEEDRRGAATPMRLDDLLATLAPRWYRRERAGPRVPVRFCVDAIRSYVRRFGISILIRRIEERDGNSRFACVVRACNRCRLRSNDLVAARVGIPDPNVRRYKSEKDGICTPKAAHRQRETDEKRG